ncbi:MAG: hypothetical protein OXB95_05670, partial [Rhodobacteraceae bacterium]|nr:hypothetical protein [Paracoccaceae bacterium]
MTEWRFYGRRKALADLEDCLGLRRPPVRVFSVVKIVGRRGVGKNALLEETARRGTQGVPVVICALPSPDEEGPEVLPNSLERAAVAAGLGSLHARLLPTLEARGPKFQFCEMIAHLLMEGA